MVNHKEILRLKSLGLTHCEIADAAGCGRNTVTRTLARAREQKLNWQQVQSLSQQEVTQRLFPTEQTGPVYKMPDYEWVHREMQKSGVTLSLLWVEYCEQCRQAGELPYKSTQFNKYYADYVHKTKATMHPVSYTHLDVYKRQVHFLAELGLHQCGQTVYLLAHVRIAAGNVIVLYAAEIKHSRVPSQTPRAFQYPCQTETRLPRHAPESRFHRRKTGEIRSQPPAFPVLL